MGNDVRFSRESEKQLWYSVRELADRRYPCLESQESCIQENLKLKLLN